MSIHLARLLRFSSVASTLAIVVAAGCTSQGMAKKVPMDMAGNTSQGPAPIGVVPSSMGEQLTAAGFDLHNLPPTIEDVGDDHIEDVMKIIAASLGAKCSDCHTMDKMEETTNKRIARKMWEELVVKLTLKDGTPLFCDSCHQGKLEFIDRTDENAIGGWMKTNFVDALARKDGQKHTCSTCHGTPFVGGLLDVWGADPSAVDGGSDSDGGVSSSDGGVVVTDAGTKPDMAQPTVPDMAQPTGTCKVVINELQVAGPAGAGDEFIELFNPCTVAVSLETYSLVYRSAAGSTDSSLVKLSGQSLAAGAYLVIGGSSYGGTAAVKYTAGLAGGGGGVGLRDGATLVDSVGYGTATNAFVHGSAAPAPASGKSISRTPNGAHTHNDDALDFVAGTPTAGASN